MSMRERIVLLANGKEAGKSNVYVSFCLFRPQRSQFISTADEQRVRTSKR